MEKEYFIWTNAYGFTENEKEILNWWEEEKIFQKLKAKNKNGHKYRFIDGPITANNPMGIHHVWGRTLKDTFLRFKAMNGFESHYRNGFDGQGLWVEVEVEKELKFEAKKDIETYGIDKFSQRCIERVERCAGIITDQSKRLGQWMDWENSYYTHKDENITGIWTFLKTCSDHGWIKKIHRPMPWCPRCGTSLSEHEMTGSYKELEHEAVFARLPLKDNEADILVWTTTPWTLAANTALAVNKDLDYVLVQLDEGRPLWMGKNYYNRKYSCDGKNECVRILEEVKGDILCGLQYETFFPEIEEQKNLLHKIVLWEEVTEGDGCQVVHIAPGCGAEDYGLGVTEDLPKIVPIDEAGIFYKNFGFLKGKEAKTIRAEVFQELKLRGKLHYTHKHKHSYPVCWRCKEEVLFRLVDEWAIDVEEIRPKLLENTGKVTWNPPYQEKRMTDWLLNMGDWCISRSRYYGLPLPIYECSCGTVTVIGSRKELKEKAVQKALVDELPHLHRPWIDAIAISCPHCNKEVSRIKQVGDVWLDAGIVPFSTMRYFEDRDYWKSYFPAECVIEMKEQIRLWFYSMLFMSTVLTGEPPYEQVSTYGMVTAEDGSKFSKTGFMIRFDEAADAIGADASRYLFAQTPIANDVRFGYNLGEECKRKLLNFYNIAVFFTTYAEIDHPFIDLMTLQNLPLDLSDKWLMSTISTVIRETEKGYKEYNTKDVLQQFEKAVDDISNFYIRINRKRYWKEGATDDKKAAYTVLFYCLKTLTQIAAPILPFLTEYIWQCVIRRYSEAEESVHLSIWPKAQEQWITEGITLLPMVQNTRDLLSLSLKIRNEKKLKVKQKLECAYLWFEDLSDRPNSYFENILKTEMNVNRIEYTEVLTDFRQPVIKLNFREAGQILKGELNTVNNILKELSYKQTDEIVQKLLKGENVRLPGIHQPLEAGIFSIEYDDKSSLGVAVQYNLGIALDINITESLKQEGLLRMLLRQCQVARKKAGYRVSDKIYLKVDCSKDLQGLISREKAMFESELLASLTTDFIPDYSEDILLDNYHFTINLKLINN